MFLVGGEDIHWGKMSSEVDDSIRSVLSADLQLTGMLRLVLRLTFLSLMLEGSWMWVRWEEACLLDKYQCVALLKNINPRLLKAVSQKRTIKKALQKIWLSLLLMGFYHFVVETL